MKSTEVTIKNKYGIHARVAHELVEKCAKFKSEISFCKENTCAKGSSILEILMLGSEKGSQLKIRAVGEDENNAIQELDKYFADGGGI